MTLSEFKFWLQGFEMALKSVHPNAEEWAAIKEKLYEIEEPVQPLLNPPVKYREPITPFHDYVSDKTVPKWDAALYVTTC